MVFHSSSASFSSSLSHSHSRFSCAASSSSASASSSPSSSPSHHPPFSDCSRRGILAANATHSSQYAAPSTVPFLWEEKPGVLKRVQGDQNPSRLYNALNEDHRTDDGNSNENGGNSHEHGGFDGNSCERGNVNGRIGDGCYYTSYGNENAKILDSRIGLQNLSHSHRKGHSHGRSSAVFQEQPPRLRLPPRLLAPDQEDHVTTMKEQSATVTSGRTHRRNSSGSSIFAENSRRKHRMYGSIITSQRGLSMDDDPFLLAFMVCKNEEKSFSETSNSAATRISKSIHLEEQNMHFDQCIPRMNNGKLSMKAVFPGKMSRERKLQNVRGNGPAMEGSSSKGAKSASFPNHAKHSNVPLCSSSSSAVVDISCAYQHVVKNYKTKTRLFPDLLGCRTDNARLLPFQPTPLH